MDSNAYETRASLLLRLRDLGDAASWAEFSELYGPLIYRYARRQGLQDADARDVQQEVLAAVCQSIDRFDYDPGRGRFRSWLYRIARFRLNEFYRRTKRGVPASGDTAVYQQLAAVADEQDETAWNADFEQTLFQWAAERVRQTVQPHTWQAFWLTAIEGRPAEQVARKLKMRVGAVYVARSRVLARIREKIQEAAD